MRQLDAHRTSRAAFASELIEATEKAGTDKALLPAAVPGGSVIGDSVLALKEQCQLQSRELEDLNWEFNLLEGHLSRTTRLLKSQNLEFAQPDMTPVDTKMLFEQCKLQGTELQELEDELEMLHARMVASQS